jgi:hypothetical protein
VYRCASSVTHEPTGGDAAAEGASLDAYRQLSKLGCGGRHTMNNRGFIFLGGAIFGAVFTAMTIKNATKTLLDEAIEELDEDDYVDDVEGVVSGIESNSGEEVAVEVV